ncbi:hypothetical protein ANN_09507 [Periplaneta americana]|uniref:Reverse transcriptase domain-containing protein n=1 Tax=Periplaneta americana TaxID=6978 RepID=A0ABQ8TP28_PERAM|nr:hypothetical protein ANN_09507 [Periplaneta americana]
MQNATFPEGHTHPKVERTLSQSPLADRHKNKCAAARTPNHTQKLTAEEVTEAIHMTKNNKAVGPDNICNEHLKTSLDAGRWRTSTMKVMYKRKDGVGDMNAYRRIAFKVFSKLLTKSLTEFTDNTIPEEQFGFRQGRSTLQAVQCLLNEIFEILKHRKKE